MPPFWPTWVRSARHAALHDFMEVAPRRVGILLFDGVKMLDVAGPAEVFAESNLSGMHYDVATVSISGGPVSSSIGPSISATASLSEVGLFDTVIIPGGGFPRRPVTTELVDAALQMARGARRISSVCTGAFVLAAGDFLAGRQVATHWAMAAELARRYPGVRVKPDAIWVKDGPIYSSGGVAAGIDLALALVEEDHGALHARSVARNLVVYMKRPGGQSQFSAPLQGPPARSEALRRATDRVLADPSETWTPAALAAEAGVSRRQLARLFREEMGTTPGRFVEHLRFDLARALLDDGLTATQAAAHAGFASYEALRRVFVKRLAVAPGQYQQRFATTTSDATPVRTGSSSWNPVRP